MKTNLKTSALGLFALLLNLFILETNAQNKPALGDVNIRTLNFFLPVVHLSQPCYIPIEIRAAYNSYSASSSIFGKKWTFNHNIRVREAVTHFEVIEGDGFVNKYTREKNLEEATNALVEKIIIAVKKEDAKNKAYKDDEHYKKLTEKLKNDKVLREEQARQLISVARPLGAAVYYSLARGQSELEKKADGSFERRFQNGSKEVFNKKGQIVRSEDRNKNYLNYVYQSDDLNRINDMCGRSVGFVFYSEAPLKGLVRYIKDGLGRQFEYGYDQAQRLTSFTDSSNKTKTEYRYDKMGNIVEISISGDQPVSSKISYNDRLEVESKTAPQSSRTTFKRNFVANNPNHSITEVIKYRGKDKVARELHEFKQGEYEVVSKFNAENKEVSKETKRFSAETGYPVSIFDQNGRGSKFKYDSSNGNLLEREAVPSGEKMTFSYIDRCNQINTVSLERKDEPKKVTSYTFDKACNVTSAQELTGSKKTGRIEVKYNENGKTQFLTDTVNDHQIAFTYWKYGKPESITLKDVGTLLVSYKPEGSIEKVDTFPHGKAKEASEKETKDKGTNQTYTREIILRDVKKALDSIMAYLKPAGLNIGI